MRSSNRLPLTQYLLRMRDLVKTCLTGSILPCRKVKELWE
jgi:hypothetical protein